MRKKGEIPARLAAQHALIEQGSGLAPGYDTLYFPSPLHYMTKLLFCKHEIRITNGPNN